MNARAHAPWIVVLALAALVRFVALADLPAPAGDEANWTGWALDLHRGHSAEMPAEASFVSMAFAHILAASFDVFGASSFAARAPSAAAILLAIGVLYAVLAKLGGRRAAFVSSAVLALHPWSVAWSRTAAVPYALALATSTIGACLVALGVARRHGPSLGAGIVVVAVGANFTPLTAATALGAGSFALAKDARFVLRSPFTWAGVALAVASVAPRVLAALHVAHVVSPSVRAVPLATKLAYFGHMVVTELPGEATLRHFGHGATSLTGALVLAAPFVAALVWSATYDVRSTSPTRGLGGFLLIAALVALPVLLAPARLWYLPDVDRERYLFVLLPGLALALGDLAESTAKARRFALALLGVVAIGTARLGLDAARGGGLDHGTDVFAKGEGYRGFRATRDLGSPARHIADELQRHARRGSGIVLADASMRPIGFETVRRFPLSAHGHPAFFFAEAEYFPDPYSYTGDFYFVLWDRRVFARTATTLGARTRNETLRTRMLRDYANVRLVRRYAQPNGAPLIELWRGRRAAR